VLPSIGRAGAHRVVGTVTFGLRRHDSPSGPISLLERLQSALNGERRCTTDGSHNCDQVTPLLRYLHWSVFRNVSCFGLRRSYNVDSNYSHRLTLLKNYIICLMLGFRQRLRSASTTARVAQNAVHTMIGEHAFPVAAARVSRDVMSVAYSFPAAFEDGTTYLVVCAQNRDDI